MRFGNLGPVLGFFAVCACLIAGAAPVAAQNAPGVTENEILIGSCSALEGPSKSLGTEMVAGAKIYFSMINDEGGVHGRKLHLIASDDSYDPAKTQGCFDKLMAEKVFALGFFVGTPTAVKYLPLAEENKVPLVGLFTGAQTLYVPLRHWVVNVRASYFDETREQIDGMWNARLQENRCDLSRGCLWLGSARRRKGSPESPWCRAGRGRLVPAADGSSRRRD